MQADSPDPAGSPEGILEGIWVKRVRRGPMDPVDEAELVEDQGIAGSANQGGWRQVTILEREVWDRVTEQLGASLDPSVRRANLLVRGIRLAETRDRVLEVGEARIRIRGETRPCNLMEEACPGLRAALDPEWGGGAFGQIVVGGRVRPGDAVRWIE